MRKLFSRYMERGVSRRGFIQQMMGLGFTAAAANAFLQPLEASEIAATDPASVGASTLQGTGGELVLAQAKAVGVEYLFTNPGSIEVGLFDALVDDPQIHLIMGLHEGVVISMADGYHRASLKPAFVNVHAAVGTAQMAGQLANASRDGSALVITAGLNDNEIWSDEILLAPPPGFSQKDINRQFTKISWEGRRAESLPLMLRRAFKVAATPPGGPVYLAMAHYALEAKGATAGVLPAERFMIQTRVHADRREVERAARLLAEAKRPIVLAGDEVWKSSAQHELLNLSEGLGLPVIHMPRKAYVSFPAHHPHNLGTFSMTSAFSLPSAYAKRGVDLILFAGCPDVGGRSIPQVPELPEEAHVIRLGMDTAAFSRNFPTDVALVSDVKAGLLDLQAATESLLTGPRLKGIGKSRSKEIQAITAGLAEAREKEITVTLGQTPMHPSELGLVMARTIRQDAIVLSENLTGKYDSFPFGFRENEQVYIGNSASALGWGIGAAIGVKLAEPNRQVVCCIGDGSLMYSASGFWTQARYEIPVLTVVWNNQNYQTVRLAYHRYGGKMASSGKYPGMYLGDPEIDFVKLAESQGVSGERVETVGQLEEALKRGVAKTREGKPYLIDVVIARYGDGAESTWHDDFSLASRRRGSV